MEFQRVAQVEKPADSPEAAAIWRALVEEARQRPWMWRFLTIRGAALLDRVVANYRNLLALSRQQRRALMRRAGMGLAGAALLLSLGSGPVFAADITVDGTCTLADAITAANTDTATGSCSAGSGADTITLQGNVTLTATNNFSNDSFANNGLPVVTSEITIDGGGFTISRSSADQFRILEVSASGDLTLSNATLSGGHPQRSGMYGSYDNNGGAVWNAGNLAVVNTTITGNTGFKGGGVYNSGTATLQNSTISSNTAYYGGGVYNYNGTATLQNSTISSNTANGKGGGVYTSGGNLSAVNSTISGNSTYRNGGGLHLSGPATITGSTISGNSTSGNVPGYGGSGISIRSGHTVTIANSTISGNTGERYGGGILNSGTVTLNHTTVTGNTNRFGGGIWNSGTLQLNHSLISGNAGYASGTYIDEIQNYTGGTVTLDNENLIGHSGLTNADAYSGFTRGTTDITATTDGTNATPLTTILNTTLADNGGPTLTHAIPTQSPAKDAIASGSRMARSGDAVAAPPAQCTPGTTAGSSYDQRGVWRANGTTTGTACDIGAFEYGQAPTAVTIAGFSSQTAWGSGPQLAWETGSETGLSGFHIWLGTSSAARTRLTDALIGAAGGLNGGEYTWQDAVVFGWGERVWYWLEAVNADGSSSFTGPVEVWGIGRLFLPAIGR